MSTPSPGVEGAVAQNAAADADAEGMTDIPQRLMRVKILYTFDDQNKSNCLARLPTALSIPTVSLDDTMQVGVIELKTCIQAIVSASPELVAKLGHDYTVYAYDFSEYETPLVGQGMLSWILASASTTPNAPAEESQTMVTGRVCSNLLGLFSNGIKETLEVKLKLVPVPTCMQSEYVENMERYHSLSKIMPEGMDYKEWAEFLKENPAIGQLAQPAPRNDSRITEHMATNAIESFNEMMMNNSSFNQHRMSFGQYDTRPSSPATSIASNYPYHMNPEFRPTSQASFHSESGAPSPYYQTTVELNEQQEEGPPKKRAKVTKAKRPKKTTLGPHGDSLRVTASTAASVRLHRPTPVNVGAAVSAEQGPRAPTPRPHHAGLLTNCPRIPAPSRLRNASTDEGRPYMSPFDSGIFSDNAVDSADDDKGDSPSETPPNMPSSPPLLPRHATSPVPSSPELPMLPTPNDSGFASDIPIAHGERGGKRGRKRERPTYGRSETEPTPLNPNLLEHFMNHIRTNEQGMEASVANAELDPAENAQHSRMGSNPPSDAAVAMPLISQPTVARSATPNTSLSAPKAARGLTRSQTWAGEPMSDAVGPNDEKGKQPRSGSGAKRHKQTKDLIKERLEEAIMRNYMPTYCHNCGEIETPAWRKTYSRIYMGTPEKVDLSSRENGVVAIEILNPDQNEGSPHYKIYKSELAPQEKEKEEALFESLTLCNPCGLWLTKKHAMRPSQVWGRPQLPKPRAVRSADKPKMPRKPKNPKKPKHRNDPLTSDAVIPESDSGLLDSQVEGDALSSLDGAADGQMLPHLRTRTEGVRNSEGTKLDESSARAALERAFQSSPVGVRDSGQDATINLDGDLTPKPTRRLLFPSPRNPGETKSLADNSASHSSPPRSVPSKLVKTPMQNLEAVTEEGDKENCPPQVDDEDDYLVQLFESPKDTSPKSSSYEDLLKTPTPGTRQRVPLTPVRHAEVNLVTPSKSSRTPRGTGRAATLPPETPFTRQLNELMSESMLHGSPSQHFDFSAFPAFNTPGRNSILPFGDLLHHDSLSSDLPIPSSSPPKNFDFSVFEDPNTNTVGLWSGASIFDINDAMMSEAPAGEQENGVHEGNAAPKILTVNGISLDLSAMIDEVVGKTDQEERDATSATSMLTAPVESRQDPVQQPVPQIEDNEGHREREASPNGPVSIAPSKSQRGLVPQPVVNEDSSTTFKKRESTSPAAVTTVQAPAVPLASRPDLVPKAAKVRPPVRGEYDPPPAPKPRCLRCKRGKKGCDRQRPCGRCVRANCADSCTVDEEAAPSPVVSVSVESPGGPIWVQPDQAPSVPVDPALEATTAPKGQEQQAASPSIATETSKEVREGVASSEPVVSQALSPSVTNDGTVPASASTIHPDPAPSKAGELAAGPIAENAPSPKLAAATSLANPNGGS